MEQEILLISETFLKEQTSLSDNLSGKLVLPSIREAQEVFLREILGDSLLDALKTKASDGTIKEPGNEMYLKLAKECRFFIAYRAASELCILTAVKVDNAGLSRVNDERMTPVSMSEVETISDFYKRKADFYAYRLQEFLIENSGSFKELCDNSFGIQSNTYSSYSSSLWLGGARGRMFVTLENKNNNKKNYDN